MIARTENSTVHKKRPEKERFSVYFRASMIV